MMYTARLAGGWDADLRARTTKAWLHTSDTMHELQWHLVAYCECHRMAQHDIPPSLLKTIRERNNALPPATNAVPATNARP